MHTIASQTPSAWVLRWAHLVPADAKVLDLACGSGRHVRWFASQGCAVTAVDRDTSALEGLKAVARTLHADIEQGPWPLEGQAFDAVVVTNYLWRPLFPQLLACLAPGGALIYETFATGQGSVGRPSRPEFLLEPGELLQLTRPLRTVAFEDGFEPAPERFVQRIAAVRERPADTATPPRHMLSPAVGR